jgi:hypothetical protein
VEVSVQNFTQVGGHAHFLHPFILGHVSGLIRFHVGYNKGTASNFVQILEKV